MSLVRAAKQELKAWADRAELGGGPEGEVHLERAREQENPEERLSPPDVEVMHGAVLVVHARGPVVDHVVEVGVDAHAEREVDIGPAVLAADRSGSRQGRGGDARIIARGGDQRIAQPGSIGRGEHRPIVARP